MLAALALALASAETRIAATEARLALLDRQRAAQTAEIAAAQAPLARLLAAIERLAQRPSALVFARPGSLDDLIHAQALFGALRPAIVARTAVLRREAVQTRALRTEAARTLAAIAIERSGFETMLGARLMRLPAPPEPASAAAAAFYRLPAAGIVISGTGERAEPGWRARGLTLLTAPGITVSAPAAGRVAYAGPFGGYGQIVILDHGHGWTTLLAGLGRADVVSAASIDRGAVLGRMGQGAPRLIVELRHNGRPVDVTGMAAQ